MTTAIQTAPDAPARIAPEYEKIRSVQAYGAKPRIRGVALTDLRRMVEEGGEFQELGRFTDSAELEAFPGFRMKQMNYSVMEPGAIKAFHLHLRQEDVWFVPPSSKLLVGLLDCRQDSPTRGAAMRLALGDGKSQLLYIPRGVAHGAANLSARPGTIVYFVNQTFSVEEPDEHRLPHDVVGSDFWSIPPG